MVHLVSNLVILMHRNMIFGMMFLPYTCSYILRRILKMKCMLKIISITFQYGLILIKGLITNFFFTNNGIKLVLKLLVIFCQMMATFY